MSSTAPHTLYIFHNPNKYHAFDPDITMTRKTDRTPIKLKTVTNSSVKITMINYQRTRLNAQIYYLRNEQKSEESNCGNRETEPSR